MTGKTNSKQRFVRCPKCLNVLAEPSDIPVYKCGGCGATLQAKKRNNSTVDTTSRRWDNDSSGKQKVDQVFGDQIQEAGSSSYQHLLLNSNDEPDKDKDAAKIAKTGLIDSPSSGKQKQKQLSDDHEASSSLSQQEVVNSIDEPHRNTDNDPRSSTELSSHEDPESSPEATGYNRTEQQQNKNQNQDQDQDHNQSSGKQKTEQQLKQLSDDHEASSSSNQQLLVNPLDEPHRNILNDPRSSTELSGHEDPESSPEATGHHRTEQQKQNRDQDQDQDQDHSSGKQKTEQLSKNNKTSSSLNQQLAVNFINNLDQNNDHYKPSNSYDLSDHEDPDQIYNDDNDQVFLSCRHDVEFDESSSEFEEPYSNTKIIRSSDYGSKSSFKSLITERLLDSKQKKPVYQDENDDVLSEDSIVSDLHRHHRKKINRISSVETTETTRFGNYYEYGGSESSFDGNDIQNPRKHRIGPIEDEHVDRFNRRDQIHHLDHRLGKHVHRSTEIQSIYGHRGYSSSENPKLERLELLKKVRELTDQLERTNVHGLNSPVRYGRRMAFSGETTAVNRRLDGGTGTGTCHHCYPHGPQHFSAQLPRQAQHVCCSGPRYKPDTYYSPRVSGLSTPMHTHPESEFSTLEGGYSYKQRNDVGKPYRSPMKKRYVRPVANGAPWIMCYRCSKLLELPQSLFVFNKRYHSLRCGACMEVLNFTLSNGTHVSRYYPEETIAAPPSSEVGDYNELNRSLVEPVSYSDRSFQKSYSTETERKAAMSRDPSGSSQPSSSKVSGWRKMTSEIEVEPRPNGSPLHRLMGYATPSKVIRG